MLVFFGLHYTRLRPSRRRGCRVHPHSLPRRLHPMVAPFRKLGDGHSLHGYKSLYGSPRSCWRSKSVKITQSLPAMGCFQSIPNPPARSHLGPPELHADPRPHPALPTARNESRIPIDSLPCLHCGTPTYSDTVMVGNPNGNGGRPYRKCGNSECGEFAAFTDFRGIQAWNPPCRCTDGPPSRMQVSGCKARQPGQVHYVCASGRCLFRSFPRVNESAWVLTPQQIDVFRSRAWL